MVTLGNGDEEASLTAVVRRSKRKGNVNRVNERHLLPSFPSSSLPIKIEDDMHDSASTAEEDTPRSDGPNAKPSSTTMSSRRNIGHDAFRTSHQEASICASQITLCNLTRYRFVQAAIN